MSLMNTTQAPPTPEDTPSPLRFLTFALIGMTLLTSCAAAPDDDDDSPPDYPDIQLYDFESAAPWFPCPEADSFPDEATVVTAFDETDQNFGGENLREVEALAEFPASGDWAQVGMWFELECPEGGECDHWDRAGSVQLVLNPEAAPENQEQIELLRHVTPYRRGMCQFVDVTALASLFQGTQTLRSWIDTWVGPGHSDGDGWRTTVRFVMYPGPPAGATQVQNIWGRRSITVGQVEEGQTVDDQIEPVIFRVPGDTERVIAHLTTTGHSFGNSGNCAEFCEMQHNVVIDGQPHPWSGWRDDCDENPVSPQAGTWEYPRNGWCPGATAGGGMIDITKHVVPGEDTELDLEILLSNGFEYNNVSPGSLLPYTFVSLKLYSWSEE